MSGLDLALHNLLAWSLQVAALGLAAALLERLVPIGRPAARLALGQALLAAVIALPLLQPWPTLAGAGAEGVGMAVALEAPSAPPVAPKAPAALDWRVVAAALVLVSVLLGVARLLTGLLRLRVLHRRACPLDSPPWLLALRDELAPRTRFVSSPDVRSPATFGRRRPIVVLPTVFATLDPEAQRAVAVHELLHARRGDWLPLVLEELTKAVLFFHPTVHWLVGRIRLAREQVVDAEAVDWLGHREAYLQSLVAVGRLAARSRAAVPAALFLRESHLRERVELLLKGISMTRTRSLAHASLSVLGLALVATWTVSAAPLHSAPAGDEAVPAARIVDFSGDVQVMRVGTHEWERARLDEPLDSGDLVRTSVSGRATLRFASGARIDVRPASLLTIHDGTAQTSVDTSSRLAPSPVIEPEPAPRESPERPRLIHQVRPAYPPDAKAEGVEGVFVVDVVIGTDGAVRDARAVASAPSVERLQELGSGKKGTPAALEGDPRLEKAALDAVRQWRYEPAVRDGAPVEAKLTAVVTFQIY